MLLIVGGILLIGDGRYQNYDLHVHSLLPLEVRCKCTLQYNVMITVIELKNGPFIWHDIETAAVFNSA